MATHKRDIYKAVSDWTHDSYKKTFRQNKHNQFPWRKQSCIYMTVNKSKVWHKSLKKKEYFQFSYWHRCKMGYSSVK